MGYIDTSLCACQTTWLVNLIEKIAGESHVTMIMKIGNMSTINLAKNMIAHGRSKHIEMRFHCLREQVSNGKLNFEH